MRVNSKPRFSQGCLFGSPGRGHTGIDKPRLGEAFSAGNLKADQRSCWCPTGESAANSPSQPHRSRQVPRMCLRIAPRRGVLALDRLAMPQ